MTALSAGVSRRMARGLLVGSLAVLGILGVPATSTQAGVVTWVSPTEVANSNANVTVSTSYTTNYGLAFQTGASGPFSIDWAQIQLNTSNLTTGGTQTFKLALRNTTNTTAYSAAAGTTLFAEDVVSFTMPATSATAFDVAITKAMIPNISAYAMTANTAYSLILYNPSVAYGIQRHTGYASGTTNNFYTVNEGFTMLNTFRNNSTYSNNASSFPSLMISFGKTTPNAVPEPSTLATAALATLLAGGVAAARSRQRC